MLMVTLMGLLAFAVDLGYVYTVRTQLQRTADAGALAGASALYAPTSDLETYAYYLPPDPAAARADGRRFVQQNPAGAKPLDVYTNEANVATGDIVLGRLYNPTILSEPLDTATGMPNSVRVRIPLFHDHLNGSAPLFFARSLGLADFEMSATATATIWYPALLPFATSVAHWESVLAGGGPDTFAYQRGEGDFGIVPGSDGVPEVVMFPGPWNGTGLPPGNFGIVQVGPGGDVLEALRRQIDMGPDNVDMDYHGGKIQSGDQLGGRTGIKSATKHAFLGGWADSRMYAGMLGRPRQLPLFNAVQGNGTNSIFTIDRFAAVRVMGIKIGGRWRIDYADSEGNEIEAIMVQPLTSKEELIQVQITR